MRMSLGTFFGKVTFPNRSNRMNDGFFMCQVALGFLIACTGSVLASPHDHFAPDATAAYGPLHLDEARKPDAFSLFDCSLFSGYAGIIAPPPHTVSLLDFSGVQRPVAEPEKQYDDHDPLEACPGIDEQIAEVQQNPGGTDCQSYRGLYRNEYFVSALAKFYGWDLIEDCDPEAVSHQETTAFEPQATPELTVSILAQSLFSAAAPVAGPLFGTVAQGALLDQCLGIPELWSAEYIESSSDGIMLDNQVLPASELLQPLFVIYQLDGKEFLVPSIHAKRWNYVPTYANQPVQSCDLPKQDTPAKPTVNWSLIVAEGLEQAGKKLLELADQIRTSAESVDGVHQVAQSHEEAPLN